MKVAAMPGSYDPVTVGHVDVIRRTAALFGRVYVVAMNNADKDYLLSPAERLDMLREALAGIGNVTVEYADGYFYEYARARGVTAIVKGVRSAEDFCYELEIAAFNRRHYPQAETLLMPADPGLAGVSARQIKARIGRGEDVSGWVTPACLRLLEDKILKSK